MHPFGWVIWWWILSSVRPGQSSFEISENNRHSTQNGLSSTFLWCGAALAQTFLNDKKKLDSKFVSKHSGTNYKKKCCWHLCDWTYAFLQLYGIACNLEIWLFCAWNHYTSGFSALLISSVQKRICIGQMQTRKKKCTSKIEMSTMNSLWKCYEKE